MTFAGYYGYNGPIDIQKLREAAVDYYESMLTDRTDNPKLVNFEVNESSRETPHTVNSFWQPIEICKSYEFNVGRFDYKAWQKAS
ncbi:MAG: hypothetical protein R3F41_00350 [Gammaproteobacteria bacterium]|nr:hypothetical protein [Pseudomonadales bacterium]MCP5346240.1 hypothetical protein [Pseudomonadales bacterium]